LFVTSLTVIRRWHSLAIKFSACETIGSSTAIASVEGRTTSSGRNDFAQQRLHSGLEALVGKDWKYMYWPEDDVEQLFDLKMDPCEEHDLAGEASQQKRLAEMRYRF
jgi:hypothetical protein